MSKTKIRYRTELNISGTREARLQAAQTFVEGDRVRHNITGKLGKFIEVNLGFALPEVWIEFDSDTEIHIPLSCNPLLIELANKDGPQGQTVGESVLLEEQKLHESALQILSSVRELQSEPEHQSISEVLSERIAVAPEVSGELTAHLGGHRLEVEAEEIIKEVSAVAATIDETQVAAVEVVEELSEQELAERHRLELKVERAFVEAGTALRELRDRRLYRSTHKSWEAYCKDRFGYGRDSADLKILAAEVVQNLENLPTNGRQVLPTSERQIRPLTRLEPDEQRQIWQEAIEASSGKLPSGRIVKSIVERLKEKQLTKATNFCVKGDVFLLTKLVEQERKYNGCWAIAIGVNDFTVKVEVHDALLTVKPENLNPIDSADVYRQLPSILNRIKRLRESGFLDRGAYNVLEDLGRHTYLTEVEEGLLSWLENHYGLNHHGTDSHHP